MPNFPLIITVISDLHCKHSSSDKKDGIPMASTILYSDSLRTDSTPQHPVHSLLLKINKEKKFFKSDILLCPGDITDKIDYQGYITGWSFLEEIKESIEANNIYATIGNHDVDSRRKDENSLPFHVSRSIKYNFPFSNKSLQEDFWNNNFCIVEDEKYVLLILNSTYSHLSATDAGKAKISQEIINKIDEKFSLLHTDKPKIALCHHHPLNHSNVSSFDTDVLDKGELLLDMLCRHSFTIFIHGHKHEIKLRYYNSLLVFCAGSFSSLENIRETESNNVFHQIQIFQGHKGLIKTWIYGSRSGWLLKSGKNFPAVCGFGYHGEVETLSNKISDWFAQQTNQKLEHYNKLKFSVPDVEYLLPHQQKALSNNLKTNHAIEITFNEDGIPIYISKLITDD